MKHCLFKMNFTYVPFMLILIGLSACSLHTSNVPDPPVDMPDSFSTEGREPSLPAGRWWERFEDDRLNRLMSETFQHNLDIAQSYERLVQSQAALRAAGASGGPTLSINASGGKTRQAGLAGPVTSETYSLSAAAAYEIDLWGKLKSGTEAARYEALATEENLKSLFISISAQLADLYYLAVEQRAQLELSDQTIASFRDTLDRVERRYRGGLVPAIDVYQSRQNLASAMAQRPLFESRLAETLNSISVLTGNFPDHRIGGNEKDLNDSGGFDAGIPSQLLERRPDINAAFLRIRASDERVAAAIADRFPSFSLTGTYGGSGNRVRNLLDSPNIFWNALLQAAQPVIDSGRRKAEVDRTESVFRERLAAYHKTVLEAFREVEDALAGISASEERIRRLGDTVEASESSLRLALERYMQGLTDYLPVLTEQLRHFEARSNLLTAKRELISGRIQLVRALGGEWTDEVLDQYTGYRNAEVEKK